MTGNYWLIYAAASNPVSWATLRSDSYAPRNGPLLMITNPINSMIVTKIPSLLAYIISDPKNSTRGTDKMAATMEDDFKFTLEVHFAQRLAGNVTKIRERTVKKLKRWISARSTKQGG